MIVSPPGSNRADVTIQIISNLYHNHPDQHILVVAKNSTTLESIFDRIKGLDIDPRHLIRLGHDSETGSTLGEWGKAGRVNAYLQTRLDLLAQVDRLAQSLHMTGAFGYTCETAGYFFTSQIKNRWESFWNSAASSAQTIESQFPFTAFFSDAAQPLFKKGLSLEEAKNVAQGCYAYIQNIFKQLEEIRAFEILRTGEDRVSFLLMKGVRIVALTSSYASVCRQELLSVGFKYQTLIMEEASQMLEIEGFIPMTLQPLDIDTGISHLERVIMIGDHRQVAPAVRNAALDKYANLEQSLFSRLIRLGVPSIQLDVQAQVRSSIANLYRWAYPQLKDSKSVSAEKPFSEANPGFCFEYQFVNVDDYVGHGEIETRPLFLQNLGEAEYAVAIFQYLRLLGYPAEKITLLAAYNGQKELINDVIKQRCGWHPLFGQPGTVSTIDQYQTLQNDFVILSLVRTSELGHLRDIRKLITGFSRAKLGLYVLGRRSLFEACGDLEPIFKTLWDRPTDKLWLHTEERFVNATRSVDQHELKFNKKSNEWQSTAKKGNAIVGIKSLEEMGSLVHKMAQEKITELKAQKQASMDES